MHHIEPHEKFKNEIKSECISIMKLRDGVVNDLNAMAEHMRRCGYYLLQVKNDLRHGEFMRWVIEHFPAGKTDRSKCEIARQWMRFYGEHPNLENNIELYKPSNARQLLLRAGIIKPRENEPAGGVNLDWFSRATKKIMELQGIVNKWIEQENIANWSNQRREQFRQQIEPIVDLYRKL